MTRVYACPCGWRGPDPAMSGALEIRGREISRVEIPVCPRCFHPVRSTDRLRQEAEDLATELGMAP